MVAPVSVLQQVFNGHDLQVGQDGNGSYGLGAGRLQSSFESEYARDAGSMQVPHPSGRLKSRV